MSIRWWIRLSFLSLLALAAASTQSRESKTRWYKGNLHTHTLNSDGDSTPLAVATWYREHGYQFLTLSDHNYLTEVAGLNAVLAAREKYLLIPGEEVTDRFQSKHVHINAYNLATLLMPRHGATVTEAVQNNVTAIRDAGALPSLNHPNFHWSITAKDLLAVKGLTMVEVFNGHPEVNNDGGGGFASLEHIWDTLLSAGQRVYGIAVDDAHYFKVFGPQHSNPGKGWVQVRAEELSPKAITAALERGDFYASSGVELEDVRVTSTELQLAIKLRPQEKATTSFIGENGKVLAESHGPSPVYRFRGNERYVRARVDSSFAVKAWVQPVFRN